MRLELALIVGILFFCSWCAYIVARMNSSVNVNPSAGAARTSAAAASLSQFASSNSGSGGDLSRTVNGSIQPTLIGHASTHEQQSRHFGASEPIPSAQFTPTPPSLSGIYAPVRNWPPYVDTTRGMADNYLGTESGSQQQQQWQSYALPSHAHAAGLPAPAYASQPLLLDYAGQQPAVTAVDDQDSEQGDAHDEEQEEAAAAEPGEEVGVADYPHVAGASDEEPAQGEEAGEEVDEGEAEQAPPQTELEEVANRRSFDELRSDSSERDKDGQVVVTKRRHLINGWPVVVKKSERVVGLIQGQGEGQLEDEEGHERTAASSRVPYASSAMSDAGGQSEVDFEKLVDEIDEEDKLRKRAVADKPEVGPHTAQSRRHQGTRLRPVRLIERRSDLDTPPPKQATPTVKPALLSQKPVQSKQKKQRSERERERQNKEKDSHEHSLQESLQAQQWDDDSATSGAAIVPGTVPAEIGAEEDQEEVGNIVENDQEARKLARLSRDLLLSPERVSRELDQEQERRRRKRDTIIRSSVPFPSTAPTTATLLLVPSLRNPLVSFAPASPVRVAVAAAAAHVEAKRDLSREEKIDTMGAAGANNLTLGEQAERGPVRVPPASWRADERQTVRLAEEGPAAAAATAVSFAVASSQAASAPTGSLTSKVVAATGQKQLHTNSSSPPSPLAVTNYLSNNNETTTTGHLSQRVSDGAADPHDKLSADSGAQMSGLEDMHVEVLADPPAAQGQAAHVWPPLGNPAASYAPATYPVPATVGSPLSGHAHQSGLQLASGSHKVKKKKKKVASVATKRKKKYKKANKSKMVDSKYKAARAYARKHASRHKKGQMRKKKRKSEKELVAQRKHFKGSTRGNKFARGEGAHGAKKGGNLYKDKGYKKRGFKKSYHKLETGDHKTYFDEFRDKDHHKKWKNFDDRHKYLQKKKWAGSDAKHLDAHKLKLAKARASKAGQWRESAANKHLNEMDKYKKYKNSSSKSKAIKSSGAKKKKKKKKKKERK